MDNSDEHLVAAFRDGDRTVLEELLRRHGSPLLGFLNRMLGSRPDAEDVFQETFQRMLARIDRFDASRRFKPWLYAIAHNAAVDLLRQRRRTPVTVSLDDENQKNPNPGRLAPDTAPTPAESADVQDRRLLVRQAVDRLPPRQRATVLLSYFHDMTYADIAETLGCAENTVKTHMSRALRSLAKTLPAAEPVPQSPGGDR